MKKMTKFACLVLALLMTLSLFGCGNTAEPEKVEEPEAAAEPEATAAPEEAAFITVVPGKLTVATSPDFAPYEFYALDENGDPTLAGFDVALAQYIADYLGLELDIIPMDFDGILAELAAGTVDLGLAGLSPDPDRMDVMDFSDVYYVSSQSFVSVASKADLFDSLESANDPKFTIGAQNGSIQYDLAVENTPDADIISLAKVTDIIAELLNDKMDGAFIETPVAENYAKSYPELTILFPVPYEVEGSAIGVCKGNEGLLKAVNEAIAAVLADGSMDKFISEANELSTGDIYEGLLDN